MPSSGENATYSLSKSRFFPLPAGNQVRFKKFVCEMSDRRRNIMSHAVIQDCRPFRNPGQLPEPPRPVKAFHPRKRQGIIRIVEWFHHAESPRSGKSQKLLIFPGRFPARNHCGIEPGTELGLRPARIISINVGQIGADPAGHHRRGQALLKRSQIYGYPSAKGIPDGAKSSKTVVGKGRQPVDRHAVKTHLNSIQRPVGKIPVKLFLQFVYAQ